MSETEAQDFDAEFDAAREAEEADDGQDTEAEASEESGEGEEEGEVKAEAEETPKAVLDAEKLSKTVKNLDRALREERKARRVLEDRLEADAEARRKPAAQQSSADDAMPDPNEDPIGWMKAAQRLIDKMGADERAQQEQSQRQTAQNRDFQRLNATVQESEADFKEEHPDYDEAVKHLKASIAEELQELGLTGEDLTAEFQRRMIAIAQRAIQAGKDPAETSYNLAKKRGFGVDKAATTLQKIAKGQQSARSMPAGGRPGGHLPVSEGVKLKGAAFDKWFDAEARKQRAAG